MCKLIKFKKEFFDIDRKSKDTRKTTIERDYTTLKFNFSDLTREEKKDLLITINEFLDKYITKGKNLSSEEKEEKKDKIYWGGVPVMVQWLTNANGIHEDMGLIPGLAQWVKDLALPWAVV